jgi:hypothetical protein
VIALILGFPLIKGTYEILDMLMIFRNVGKNLGKLKFEGSFDKSYFLGKKQYSFYNSKTGEIKKGSKGYKAKLSIDMWERAVKGEILNISDWYFKKFEHKEILYVSTTKKFGLSLNGRKVDDDGILKALILEYNQEKRIKVSLYNIKFDNPRLLLTCKRNEKVQSCLVF